MYIYIAIGFFLAISLVSCSGNSTNEPAVEPAFHELNIMRVALFDVRVIFKYTDNTGRERIEDEYTSFGLFVISATKNGDEFIGTRIRTDVLADEDAGIIVSFDNDVQPRKITSIIMDEHYRAHDLLTMLSEAELKDIDIHPSELNDKTITLVRSGESACNHIIMFNQHVLYDWGLELEMQSFRCTENTRLEIEIAGMGRSGN